MTNTKLPPERHFRFHRQQWQLYLLGCAFMAIGTVIAVILPGDNSEVVVMPTVLAWALMFALHLIMKGRNAEEYREEQRKIGEDEWMAASRKRALSVALLTVIFVQMPLVFFMSFVPPEPSVFGMGMMTTAVGCGAYAAAYVFHSREQVDE